MKTKRLLWSLMLVVCLTLRLMTTTALAEDHLVTVNTNDGFLAAIDDSSITTIKLSASLDLTNAGVLDVSGKTIDLCGYQISAENFSLIFEGRNFTIKNGTLDAKGGSYSLFIGDEGDTDNVVIQDITAVGGINVYNATNVVLKNTNFTGTNYYAVWCDPNGHVTIESGTFRTNGVAVLGMTKRQDGSDICSLRIKNGTFLTADDDKPLVLKDSADRSVPVFYNGSFDKAVDKDYLDSQLNIELHKNGLYTYYKTAEEAFAEAGEDGSVTLVGGAPIVAQIGSEVYSSLQEAVDAAVGGDTVRLLKDTAGDSVTVPGGKNITIDFGGHTYHVEKAADTATGTELTGFQLLKGSDITLKNGTVTSTEAKLLIQNYSNLTLDSMKLDGPHALSSSFGNTIIRDSSIIAREDGTALSVYYWPEGGYAEGLSVTIEGNSVIQGKIAYHSDGTNAGKADIAAKAALAITGGDFTKAVILTDGLNDDGATDIAISGGKFAEEIPAAYLAENFHPNKNADGTYTVHKHVASDAVKENETAPTCTKEGSYDLVVYCSICGEKMSSDTKSIPMSAHTFHWVVDKEATAAEKGLKHEECSVCGYQKAAVEVPAIGGTPNPDNNGKPDNGTKPGTDHTSDQTGNSTAAKSSQTGDNSNLLLWITLLLAAGCELGGAIIYNRMKTTDK